MLLTVDVAWQGGEIGIAGRISQAYRYHCRPIGTGQISDPSLPVPPYAYGDRDAGANAHPGTRHEGRKKAEEGEDDERETIAGSKPLFPLRRLSWKIPIAAAAIAMAVAAAAITAAAILSNSSKDELSREILPQRIIGPVKAEIGGQGRVAAVAGTAEGEAAADLLAGAALLFHTGVSILSTELHKRLGVFVPYYSSFFPLT